MDTLLKITGHYEIVEQDVEGQMHGILIVKGTSDMKIEISHVEENSSTLKENEK